MVKPQGVDSNSSVENQFSNFLPQKMIAYYTYLKKKQKQKPGNKNLNFSRK